MTVLAAFAAVALLWPKWKSWIPSLERTAYAPSPADMENEDEPEEDYDDEEEEDDYIEETDEEEDENEDNGAEETTEGEESDEDSPSLLEEDEEEEEQLVDVNKADKETLLQVSGIGGDLAANIVKEREESGTFAAFNDLTRVKGIGSRKLEQLRPYLTVAEDTSS
ncbi:ComEA family DNA-binding protein [Alkalicoccus urumqiensis]|nr:helix-hairpin-helix domain-containing protein [Alkalicoccus urumqiensis]